MSSQVLPAGSTIRFFLHAFVTEAVGEAFTMGSGIARIKKRISMLPRE